MSENQEAVNPSGLTNNEVEQLMATMIVRAQRRARLFVRTFLGLSFLIALATIIVVRPGVTESVGLVFITFVFVGGPPALFAQTVFGWPITQGRQILREGTPVSATIGKLELKGGRIQFAIEWPQAGRSRSAYLTIERIPLDHPKVFFWGWQQWICVVIGNQMFMTRRWHGRTDV